MYVAKDVKPGRAGEVQDVRYKPNLPESSNLTFSTVKPCKSNMYGSKIDT